MTWQSGARIKYQLWPAEVAAFEDALPIDPSNAQVDSYNRDHAEIIDAPIINIACVLHTCYYAARRVLSKLNTATRNKCAGNCEVLDPNAYFNHQRRSLLLSMARGSVVPSPLGYHRWAECAYTCDD
ncbi:hypothetical protein E4U59_002298 [Claviceps monticola]|nr:hypothetical protein E4U59_002298 [Claviceps monticola]